MLRKFKVSFRHKLRYKSGLENTDMPLDNYFVKR